MSEARELKPGQVWWDEHHKWTDGSDSIDMVNLILSADMEDGLYLYRCAAFMWVGNSLGDYCGANDRKFLEREVREMTYVGNISSIKSFSQN